MVPPLVGMQKCILLCLMVVIHQLLKHWQKSGQKKVHYFLRLMIWVGTSVRKFWIWKNNLFWILFILEHLEHPSKINIFFRKNCNLLLLLNQNVYSFPLLAADVCLFVFFLISLSLSVCSPLSLCPQVKLVVHFIIFFKKFFRHHPHLKWRMQKNIYHLVTARSEERKIRTRSCVCACYDRR